MRVAHFVQRLGYTAMAAACAACFVGNASASTITSVAGISGNWTDGSTWVGGSSPANNTATDVARLGVGSTVAVDAARSIAAFVNNDTDATHSVRTLNVNNNLTIGGLSWYNGCSFYVAADTGTVAIVNQAAGTTVSVAGKMSIACDGATGTYNLASGATLNANKGLWVASNTVTGSGIGVLNLNGSAKVASSNGMKLGLGTSNATLSVASTGALSVENSLTMSSKAISNFTINGWTSELHGIVKGTDATTDSVAFAGTLNFAFGSGVGSGSAKVYDFDSYSGSLSSVNFSGLRSGYTASFDQTTGILTVVPEPTVFILMLTGLMGLVAYAWRKRR